MFLISAGLFYITRGLWEDYPLILLHWLFGVLTLFNFLALFKSALYKKVVARMGKLEWVEDVFCRGWSITGSTGTGKTASAIMWFIHQLYRFSPGFGAVIVDPKCELWRDCQDVAKHYGQDENYINLEVKPVGAPPDWKPKWSYNLLSYSAISYSNYAKILADTLASVKGKKEKDFFDMQAQMHVQRTMESLAAAKWPVNLARVWDVLSVRETTEELISDLRKVAFFEALEAVKKNPAEYGKIQATVASHLWDQAKIDQCDTDEALDNAIKEITDEEIAKVMNPETLMIAVNRENLPKSWECAIHMQKNFLDVSTKAAEQFEGVRASIQNMLFAFTDPEIQRSFCADEPNFSFEMIDSGKVISISIPQRYQEERDFIFTFLKNVYYNHALARFDIPKKERKKKNLIVFIADEAQGVVTAAEDGMSDYNVIDKIRAARATVLFAAQSTTSYMPKLKDIHKVRTLLLNLKNQVYMQVADDEGAEIAAKVIGKTTYWKQSYSYSQGNATVSRQLTDEFKIKPHDLMELGRFECVFVHPISGFCRTVLPPLAVDGSISQQYLEEKYV